MNISDEDTLKTLFKIVVGGIMVVEGFRVLVEKAHTKEVIVHEGLEERVDS